MNTRRIRTLQNGRRTLALLRRKQTRTIRIALRMQDRRVMA